MRTLRSLLLVSAVGWCGMAHGQTVGFKALVVASCGGQAYPAAINGQQNYAPFTITTGGVLCTVGGGSGGGGGTAADQTGTNASDGQATSTTNQHSLAFNYIYNGTTWDRMRGVNGAANVAITAGLPTSYPDAAADLYLGAKGDAASATGSLAAQMQQLHNDLVAPTPAGTSIIGKVGIDQTTPGTTNGVVVNQSALPAGAATGANQPTNAAQGSATAGQSGTLGLAAAASAAPSLTTAQSYPLSLTLAGALRVDESAVTQPISATALPLPTGAATAANQTNVQSAAGTSASTAMGIQGITNGVPVITTPTNAGTVATAANQPTNASQGSSTSGQTGTLGLAAAASAAPSLTTAQSYPLSLTLAGALRVDNSGVTQTVTGVSEYNPGLEAYAGLAFVPLHVDTRGNLKNSETGSSDPLVGITPVVASSATALQGKGSQGNFYSAYAIAVAANSAQAYLVCVDAAATPASGATITPKDFAAFASNAVGALAQINYGSGPPDAYTNGVQCVASTSLTTYTPAANTAFNIRVR